MKASDAKKPKFDPAWWRKHKSSKADPKDEVFNALKHYVERRKIFEKEGKFFLEMLKALKKVKEKAESEAKPLAGAQKESKEALVNYAKLASKAHGEMEKIEKQTKSLKLATLIDGDAGFKKLCETIKNSENYNFLSLMSKNPVPARKWHEAFIKTSSKFEINISYGLRGEFEAIERKIDLGELPDTPETWKGAPWKAAVKEIEGVLRPAVYRYRSLVTLRESKPHLL